MEFRNPRALDGRYIRLVPLERRYVRPLAEAGKDPEIWRWILDGHRGTEEAMGEWVETLLARQAAGTDLPFVIVLHPDDRPVGMTRYLGIDRPNRNVEVGGTWITPSLWRTPVNTESKLLMLSHAFDAEACERVQIKTDIRNERSQRAIERLGAHREGVLRQHLVRWDGSFRDSVVYSILRSEWPHVRRTLEAALATPWTRPNDIGSDGPSASGPNGAARI